MRETKSGKRLLPLVQLLPAVAVAGLVLVTVPRTAPAQITTIDSFCL